MLSSPPPHLFRPFRLQLAKTKVEEENAEKDIKIQVCIIMRCT